MSGHSVLPPSSSARRVQCPASATLEPQYPEAVEGDAAAEGTAAHWAVAEQLEGRLIDAGQIAPNGIVVTDEMTRGADMVHDYLSKLLAPHGLKPSDGHIEQRVNIPRVHPMSWGTPDYWIKLPTGMYVLLDFKFGHGVVEVFENLQLVEYAAGITHGESDMAPGVPLMLVIAQPRAHHKDGPIREWKTDLLALRALINIASNAAHEALGENPRAKVGPECRHCKARHACPALQKAAYSVMDEAQRVVPLQLSPEALSLELRFARRAQELLEARISGLEAQAEAALSSGGYVPGWKMDRTIGREKWTVDAKAVIAMGSMLGLDLARPPEPVTPKQARDRGMDPEVVKGLSERAPGASKLVEVKDADVRKVFS